MLRKIKLVALPELEYWSNRVPERWVLTGCCPNGDSIAADFDRADTPSIHMDGRNMLTLSKNPTPEGPALVHPGGVKYTSNGRMECWKNGILG
ncbi:MAG: hypothetical protein HWN68_10450 [Desulfobacterales bacterium]|nr:hypothetical protein [Desulfobacterales bacterium]